MPQKPILNGNKRISEDSDDINNRMQNQDLHHSTTHDQICPEVMIPNNRQIN